MQPLHLYENEFAIYPKHLCSNTHRVKMLINTEAKFYSIAKTGARWYFIQLWDFKLFSYY